MSSRNTVQVGPEFTVKRFSDPDDWRREVQMMLAVPWAAPDLVDFSMCETVTETVTMARDRPDHKPYEELLALLMRLHDEGVNHRDVHVGNIGFHDTRGVVLIDWEHATTDVRTLSYDLCGQELSGVPQPESQRGRPMWLGSDHRMSVRTQWRA